MSEGYETLDIVEPWLISTLTDALITSANPDLVTKVVNLQNSANVEPPYLLVWLISSRDIRGVGQIRLDTDSIYGVKAVHRSNSLIPGRAVMQVVETAIGGKNITTVSGNLTCIRETMLHYPETIDGVQFMHVGANYRLRGSSD